MKKYKFHLEGLDCANCANKIQNKISENENYANVSVNFNTLKLSFESEENVDISDIEFIVKSLEPDVKVLTEEDFEKQNKHHDDDHEHEHESEHEHKVKSKERKKVNSNVLRLVCGLLIISGLILVEIPKPFDLVLIVLAYAILLFRTFINSIKLLRHGVVDENLLVTVSCVGAFIIGERFEGLMVIILYEIGKILEEKAVNNTRKSIAKLMDIKPEYANLKHGNHDHKVDPKEVKIGDTIIIKQGEKVPLDGVVIEGNANLDVSSLTGESIPAVVKKGDKVLSGSINIDGLISLKVTEKYEDSTVSKILHLVEHATDNKAKTETFVNKASKIYTPIVLILAALVAIGLPYIMDLTYSESIYRALIFLVVSCPCAIVISVPLSYFSGIGKASRKGILIKGSNYLDALRNVKIVAFDKTGTLTKGKFEIVKIKVYDKDYSEDEVLEFAAFGESYSNHPIANAIVEKYHKNIDRDRITEFKEVPGFGLTYKYDNCLIKVGNAELTGAKLEKTNGTCIYVKRDDHIIGAIILSDILKPESKKSIMLLNAFGINTMMFTGDNKKVAESISKILNIREYKADMLPNEKYGELEKIIESNPKGKVAFVGDGINDAPVIARADVGISMGGIGSSSAIEASDIVIMTDNLAKIPEAIKISRFTNKIIKQNILFALFVKIAVLTLSVLGVAQMWMAVFADVGVTLITIFNTMRIIWKK